MLKLYISNKIEKLSQQFSENIKTDHDIFSTELVVLQTSGMERWLSLQAAEKNGVFTNFRYIKPNSFINKLYQLADIEADSLYNTENLKWILFRFLDKEEFKTKFEKVAQYYQNDDIKRLQLSVKVADLFDQYLLYRQGYIENWNKGELAKITRFPDDDEKQIRKKQERLDQHQKWQFWLWNKIKKELGEEILDKVQLRDQLIQKLNTSDFQELIKSEYKRISLFGLSVITDYHIEIFYRLSSILDVNLYFLNPAPETYWYDIVSEKFMFYLVKKTGQSEEQLKQHIGNELLSNYSALAKDTYNILFKSDEFVNALDDSLTEKPLNRSLLEKIQNDIFNNNNQEERNRITVDNLSDNSLLISSSYTPMREVEALYNQLLFFLDKDKSIRPQDIIVQLSDVDLYTPYIRAVFDNSAHYLPYTIADRSYAGGDTMVGILETLLKLSFEDFTSEKILQLLNSEYIKNHFGITDVDLIRETVREANIRFGIKGYAKDDTQFVSWNYGLERILLGYAIKGGAAFNLENYSTYPIDTIEGSEMEELLRFKGFVDILIASLNKRIHDRPIDEWAVYIDDLIHNLLELDDDSNAEIKYIQQHLLSLNNMSTWLIDDDKKMPISYEVFQKSFIDAIFSNPRAGNFITGGITFCSMIPMRSIPFKITAMLGLNGDKFPRQDSKLAFNLIDIEYKRGDRNTKNNDKYLFLETILSTRKHLYLSYIGNSTKDNTEKPPSLLIEELKSYIQMACDNLSQDKHVDDYLLQKHPLHSFSQKYYEKSSQLFTYKNEKLSLEQKRSTENLATNNTEITRISIDELIRFYEDPFKYFYNKTLQIFYQEEESLLPETELFDIDNLQEWSIKNHLLLSEIQKDIYIDKAKKTGLLPLAKMADITLEDALEKIKDLKETYLNLCSGKEANSQNISIKIGDIQLEASIFPIFDNQFISTNVSGKSSQAKYITRTWIRHLCMVANNLNINSLFLSDSYNPPVIWEHNIITSEEAQSRLGNLIDFYLQAQKRIVAYEPKIGKKLAEDLYKNWGDTPNENKALGKALNSLNSLDTPDFTFGIYNQYIQKESEMGFFNLDNHETIKEDLKTISSLIYGDLIKLNLI